MIIPSVSIVPHIYDIRPHGKLENNEGYSQGYSILKKIDPQNFSEFRHIRILPAQSKTLEGDQTVAFISRNDLLFRYQSNLAHVLYVNYWS